MSASSVVGGPAFTLCTSRAMQSTLVRTSVTSLLHGVEHVATWRGDLPVGDFYAAVVWPVCHVCTELWGNASHLGTEGWLQLRMACGRSMLA